MTKQLIALAIAGIALVVYCVKTFSQPDLASSSALTVALFITAYAAIKQSQVNVSWFTVNWNRAGWA